MSDQTPLPHGAVECTAEEAARYGVGPDEPPPPMPWADVFEAAVVHVDRAGIPRDATQLAADLHSGELDSNEVPEHLREVAGTAGGPPNWHALDAVVPDPLSRQAGPIEGFPADVREVVGRARLAGYTPDARTVADLLRVSRSEITSDAATAELHTRVTRGEFREQR